jgi:hypothetical protein
MTITVPTTMILQYGTVYARSISVLDFGALNQPYETRGHVRIYSGVL